jgi:Ca-activated chloride channel family protein
MLRHGCYVSAAIAWPVGVLLATVSTAQQERPTFRSDVTTAHVYATVRGSDGALVTDLTREDFEIKDNGVPREVTLFSREIVPITVAMMLDMSWSQETGGEWAREAGHALVDALLPADRARIGTFGFEVAISPRLTGDPAYLHRILAEEVWPGGPTPLWRALDRAMTSLADESGRRVILALTDGINSTPGGGSLSASTGLPMGARRGQSTGFPTRDYANVRTRSAREGFMVYAVGRGGSQTGAVTAFMRDLATESGGGYRIFASERDPRTAMIQVVEELHRQYLLGFTPTAIDGKVHRLEVKTRRGGMTVQARKSYLAGQ